MRQWIDDMPRDSLAAYLRAEPLDLNRDGVPELVIHGIQRLCGASNCIKWIYRRTSAGYERLLVAWGTQTLEPLTSTTHGYRDLRKWQHGSAWDSGVTLYKFDGRRYRQDRCFHYSYSYLDAHDERHELKRPRITPASCGPED